ncbi:hypothetical protein VTH06DRAFT_8659 [Thermothelomyces fergusii]
MGTERKKKSLLQKKDGRTLYWPSFVDNKPRAFCSSNNIRPCCSPIRTRGRGVHFNERLAGSSGMANPALADKLLAFVGVGTEFDADGDASADAGGGGGGGGRGLEQYATVLSADVWDGGASFPEWAYRGALRRTQERVAKERERARGEAVEFVSAGLLAPGPGGAAAGDIAQPNFESWVFRYLAKPTPEHWICWLAPYRCCHSITSA